MSGGHNAACDRRLAKDYETLTARSEAMIHLKVIDNVSKRITDEVTSTRRGTYCGKGAQIACPLNP